MNRILDIAGKPLRSRTERKRFRKQDVRDFGKIATVIALIAIGYFQFAPDGPETRTSSVAMASK